MTRCVYNHTVIFAALAALVLAAFPARAARPAAKAAKGPQADRPERAQVLAAHAQSVVTLKYLLKIKSPKGGDRSLESEAPGLLLDAGGLVLCSNTMLGGISAVMRKMGAAGVTASASEIKVLVGEDSAGVPAQLVARDSDLDLAWVQIKEAAGKSYAPVDLASEAAPQLGDELVYLFRAARFLGRPTLVEEAQVVGHTDRPRALILIDGEGGNLSAPVFDKRGQLVGVTIQQMPDEAETRVRAGTVPGLVLPVRDLAQATRRAREQAARGDLPKEEPARPEPAKSDAAKSDPAAGAPSRPDPLAADAGAP